jgi:hypothetical protein
MFADPQSVTVNAVAVPLPRTGSGLNVGTFTSADGASVLSITHTYGRRNRRALRLTTSKISADALVPSQNIRSSMSVQLSVDVPPNGFTAAEVAFQVTAIADFLKASSGANVTKFIGGEA